MSAPAPRGIGLTPVRDGDLELLLGWLRRPHVSRWWGDPDQALAAVRHHPPAEHALISVDGRPIGYVCWQRLNSEELASAGLSALPRDHVDVDILIGEPESLGQGIGPVALAQVVERLRSEGASSVGLATDLENQRARLAYEKAGFQPFQEFDEAGRTMCYLITGRATRG